MIYILPPNSDAGPNDGTAVPAGPHYLNVAEDPHDGDASYVGLDTPGGLEVFGIDVSSLPDRSVIRSVAVRWAGKKGQSASVAEAGFRIGGTYHFGVQVNLTNNYGTREDVILHPDGAWTKERVVAAFLVLSLADVDIPGQSPTSRFTQAVCVVDVLDRPFATDDAATVPEAAAVGAATKGTPAAVADNAAITSAGSPSATAASIVSSGSASGPSATAAPIDSGPKAIPSAVAPLAGITPVNATAAIQSVGPSGTAAAIVPPSGDPS